MPKIPIIQSRVSPNARIRVRGGRGAFASDFSFGREIARFGQGVSDVGQFVEEKRIQDDVLRARRLASDLRVKATDHFVQSKEAAEPGAPGFTDQFNNTLKNLFSETRQQLKTRVGQEVFAQKEAEIRSHFLSNAIVFEARSRAVQAKNDYLDILNNARNTLLNDPGQFDDILSSQLETIEGLPRLSGEAKADLKAAARANLALSTVQGLINQDPRGALEQLNEGRFDKFLDADKKAVLINQAEVGIRALDSERNRAKTEANALLSDGFSLLKKGRRLDDGREAQMEKLVAMSGDADAQRRLAQYNAAKGFVEKANFLSLLNLERLKTDINHASIEGGQTELEGVVEDIVTGMLDEMKSAINSGETMELAIERGVVEGVSVAPPLLTSDMTDEQVDQANRDFKQRLAQRSQEARVVAQHFGLSQVEPFTEAETETFGRFLAEASPENKLRFATGVVSGLGDEIGLAGLEQLKQEDGVLVQATALALKVPGYGQRIALKILRGQNRIENGLVTAPGQSEIEKAFNIVVEGAFASNQDDARDIMNAAVAYLAETAGVPDLTEEGLTPDSFREAIRIAVGGDPANPDTGFADVNGHPTILPPGVTGSDFEEFIENLAPDDLVAFSAHVDRETGKKIPPYFADRDGTTEIASPADILDEGRFVEVGPNLYAIEMPDGMLVTGPQESGTFNTNIWFVEISPEVVEQIVERGPAEGSPSFIDPVAFLEQRARRP